MLPGWHMWPLIFTQRFIFLLWSHSTGRRAALPARTFTVQLPCAARLPRTPRQIAKSRYAEKKSSVKYLAILGEKPKDQLLLPQREGTVN